MHYYRLLFFFFQNHFFPQTNISGIPSVSNSLDPDIVLSGLIWVQTVSKGSADDTKKYLFRTQRVN